MPQTLAHYQLEQLIGEGGMGQVYRATDLALGRRCAVKILPPDFPGHLRDRLLLEARTAARLQHPGIATFFESGEADGQAYISMELVEGMTLRRRLQHGPLQLEVALSQTACVLGGLGHAHAVGILHRDIKPENIMLVGERAIKLLDFGLAKEFVQQQTDDRTISMLTEQGAVVGTIGYMSPEQLLGEELDERADLFSVGAVLYESISGRPAFPGKTPTERIANILTRTPDPLTGSGAMSQINTVLQKSLAKDRRQRYSSVGEFMTDLTRLASGELKVKLPNSAVVMDFDNISGNPDDQWIGTGVAESISADLSGTEGIDVTPRVKLARLLAENAAGGLAADRQKIGLTLGCRWMVTGGFQKMGTALRFTIQLNELLTDTDVLTEKVDGSVDSIFDIQDRLAELIKQRLGGSDAFPTEVETPAPATRVRPSVSAYEFFVKGREAWKRGGKGDLVEAQQFFEKAVQADPNYALAYAGLATVHALQFTYTTDHELIPLTKRLARRALKLDPTLAEAHVWLGYAYINEYDIQRGFQHQLRALELDATTVMAHYFAGGCLIATNSRSQAEGLFLQVHPGAAVADPHRWRFEQAVASYRNSLRLQTNYVWSWLGSGIAHLALDHLDDAEICLRRAMEFQRGESQLPGIEGYLCEVLRRSERPDEARQYGLAGIAAIEASDSMYRDTMRAVFLSSVGRAAMQQGDTMAASVAFNQAVQHLRGRNRARGGGHPFVQALAGLAEANGDVSALDEALQIWRSPGSWSFHFLYLCTADITLCALTRAALAIGKTKLARQLQQEAIDYGSLEAERGRIGDRPN